MRTIEWMRVSGGRCKDHDSSSIGMWGLGGGGGGDSIGTRATWRATTGFVCSLSL